MKCYVFRGSAGLYGFVKEKDESKLPKDKGPWSFFKSVDVQTSQPMIGAKPKEVLSGIEKDGYYLIEAGVAFSEQVER